MLLSTVGRLKFWRGPCLYMFLRYPSADWALLGECKIEEVTLTRLEKEIISIRTVSESETTKMIAEAFPPYKLG